MAALTAKTWHGLARAIRRGLADMQIQAFLTAAVINLKRSADAVLLTLFAALARGSDLTRHEAETCASHTQPEPQQ